MIKRSFQLTALATLVASSSVYASEFSGNIGVTSNYLFRGVTQTVDGPAVSGGLDWEHDSGFFLGTWSSNIDFGNNDGAELDLYGGYGGEAGDFSYSAAYIHYLYPDIQGDADFGEILLDFGFNVLSFGLAYTIFSEVDADGAALHRRRYLCLCWPGL